MAYASELLLENFERFIGTEKSMLSDASVGFSTIKDDARYAKFRASLLNRLEESEAIGHLLDQQRAQLLEEATSIASSPTAIAYAVASFPMLVDIYAEPLLSKITTLYPTNVPTLTIPRLKFKSTVVEADGSSKEYYFPTATELIRPGLMDITLTAASTNVFATNNVSRSEFKLNARDFSIRKIKLEEVNVVAAGSVLDGKVYPAGTVLPVAVTKSSGTSYAAGSTLASNLTLEVDDVVTKLFVEECFIVLNARNMAVESFEYETLDGKKATYSLTATVNFDTGDVVYSITLLDAAGTSSVIRGVSAEAKIKLLGIGNGRGVAKVKPEQSALDINADIDDSFEIEDVEEFIQDWKALYNIDMFASLKDAVKTQMLLNKDLEISDILQGKLGALKKISHYGLCDFNAFTLNGGSYTPDHVVHVLKNIVPKIVGLAERMRKSLRRYPSYIVCSDQTAGVIKSLQDFVVRVDGQSGMYGAAAATADFAKMEVIVSSSMPADFIYLVDKTNVISQASLIDVEYKPMYIVEEVTNSKKRLFIKSRNKIAAVRDEAIGCLQLVNYSQYLA